MPIAKRAAAVLGLSALGVIALVAPSSGQDSAVQKASTSGANPAAASARKLPAAVVGCIDMAAVFNGYTKVEFIRKQIDGEYTQKKAELSKILSEGERLGKELEQLQPGSADFKDRDLKMTKIKAEFEAARESAQREFAQKEADSLATIYKEIQEVVAAVAKHNGLNYVVQVSNDPVSAADPRSALAAMSRTVVYAEGPDVTQMVLNLLNQRYQQSSGAAPAAAPAGGAPAAAPRPTAPAGAGAGAAAPAPGAAPRPR